MSEKPKEENKVKGFLEDGKKYHIKEQTFDVVKADGHKLEEWQKKLSELETKKEIGFFTHQGLRASISKEILESSLKGSSYDELLKIATPKDLEGIAGELYGFLYEIDSQLAQEQ